MGIRLNTHGLVGVILIVLMFVGAYLQKWQIDWFYFITAVVIYAGGMIGLARFSSIGLFLPIIYSFHFAFALLVLGLWLHLSNGDNGWFYFFICVGIGTDLAHMPVSLEGRRTETIHFNPMGIIGILALVLMVSNAFYQNWNINWFYYLASIGLCSYAIIQLYYSASDTYKGDLRLRLGWYLAFLILAIGVWLPFQTTTTQLTLAIVGYFIGGIAAGLALPFLLIQRRL